MHHISYTFTLYIYIDTIYIHSTSYFGSVNTSSFPVKVEEKCMCSFPRGLKRESHEAVAALF